MQAVIIKAALVREGTLWTAGVSSRVIGLGVSQVSNSARTPHEALAALQAQLEAVLGVRVTLLLEAP